MGLDMHLIKKTYIGAEYEHRNVKGEVNITIDGKPVNVKFKRISYIIEQVGYWRKANHIHNWFVQNVQEGEDDCEEYYVSKEKVEGLLSVCKKVKENPTPENCEKLLPTQSGFFFGGTKYDEYYLNSIDNTITILQGILEEEDCGGLHYRASW